MWNPLASLRRKVAEAVLLGVQDGVQAALSEDEAPPASLKELRDSVAASVKALPPAKEGDEEPAPANGRNRLKAK